MTFDGLPPARFPRRVLLGLPFVAGVSAMLYRPERPLTDPARPGAGPEVEITLFSQNGHDRGVIATRSLLLNQGEWQKRLAGQEFAITRRKGTELAFANRYWNCRKAGMYRCVCCGNALFRSQDKFDSGTGWPSFSVPCAQGNIRTQPDLSYAVERVEVLCRKCDAHLGHVFNDGPPPSGLRYCVNSAALRLVTYA